MNTFLLKEENKRTFNESLYKNKCKSEDSVLLWCHQQLIKHPRHDFFKKQKILSLFDNIIYFRYTISNNKIASPETT